MNWLKLLEEFIILVVFPCLGLLSIYLIGLIKAKSQSLQDKIENDKADKYIQMIENTITTCVLATNQTYVESLKGKNLFDADAQKEAFRMTYNNVVKILTEDAVKYIEEMHGDVSVYLTEQIEATVNLNK